MQKMKCLNWDNNCDSCIQAVLVGIDTDTIIRIPKCFISHISQNISLQGMSRLEDQSA